jgi:hypothetical protein
VPLLDAWASLSLSQNGRTCAIADVEAKSRRHEKVSTLVPVAQVAGLDAG